MGADTSKIEGQRNDAMRERDEAIANSKREKQTKDEKIKQLAEKLTETTQKLTETTEKFRLHPFTA